MHAHCQFREAGALLGASGASLVDGRPFTSIGELVRDIEAYLSDRNAVPQPYTRKAEGTAILEKINRARAALDKVEAA